MPLVTLPNGKKLEYQQGRTVAEIAAAIGRRLAADAIAARLDGRMVDLSAVPEGDIELSIITKDSPEALEVLRHSASHVMAAAVLRLFPDARLGVGPAVEEGFYYDFALPRTLSPEDLPAIEKEMAKIIAEAGPFERVEMSRAEAIKKMREAGQDLKVELLEDMTEEDTVSFYHLGEFEDLCRGPHLPDAGRVKAVKLTKAAGAYWRGDQQRESLQRIYGIAFFSKKGLEEHLKMLEEARKRDHRLLGKQLDLFSFHDVGPGFAFWHPKGTVLYNMIEDFWREVHRERGYREVRTPAMLNEKLWHQSGHYDNYREAMYFTQADEVNYALKPMNCPGTLLIYNSAVHSYRELPIRLGELGQVHRYELSGVMQGLWRVREFTIDDAHIFCTPEQVLDEVKGVADLIVFLYKKFGFEDYSIELSTRPEKSIGTDEMWGMAEGALEQALREMKMEYKVNPGEGVFYGPKIDFHVRDCLGRTHQCGTIQIDFNFPERFDMTYVGPDNKPHRPVMIHRAALGSLERFIAFLIEHYAGKFPAWLAPVQAVILPITEKQGEYCREVLAELKGAGVRAELDERNEKIGHKVREATLEKIPYMLVVGERESKDRTVAVRTLDGADHGPTPLDAFIRAIREEIDEKHIQGRESYSQGTES
ncbi:MAG: threonine--tRNA ligase [Planctomycetota bacterium]